MDVHEIRRFSDRVQRELNGDLVPFWLSRAEDHRNGGFVGRMSNDLVVEADAPKGLILNARLLWTYAALVPFQGDSRCLDLAVRAYDYLTRVFLDREHGGFVWQVDAHGRWLDDHKKIYGQAFVLYALTEFHRATGRTEALQQAKDLFDLVERYSHDAAHQGYVEVCERDWSVAQGCPLSAKDMAEPKSMNNHLHLLEAYTRLAEVWRGHAIRTRLDELIGLFRDRIWNPETGHLDHFFTMAWQRRSHNYTFGHDIEASWLLWEAAETLADPKVMAGVRPLVLDLARATLDQGVDASGGLCYEGRSGQVTDPNREWWPQAEAVVGFLNACQVSGDPVYFRTALAAWTFIERYIIDREHGEWFWRVDSQGRPDPSEPKVSEWKEPYHGVRACLQVLHRLETLQTAVRGPTDPHGMERPRL